MRFPLTDSVRKEISEFSLRSACPHCFFARAGGASCSLEWPNAEQRRWPVETIQTTSATEGSVALSTEIDFCREFELA